MWAHLKGNDVNKALQWKPAPLEQRHPASVQGHLRPWKSRAAATRENPAPESSLTNAEGSPYPRSRGDWRPRQVHGGPGAWGWRAPASGYSGVLLCLSAGRKYRAHFQLNENRSVPEELDAGRQIKFNFRAPRRCHVPEGLLCAPRPAAGKAEGGGRAADLSPAAPGLAPASPHLIAPLQC